MGHDFIIELKDIVKVYNTGVSALDHVSFNVRPGEFIFVIGESGAGKSTLIKLLTCEEKANAGKIFLDGFDLSRLPRKFVPFLRRKIGMIFQDFRLIEGKTVYENVAFAMEIIGSKPAAIKRRVPLALTQVGLRNKAEVYPNQLSGGEAQRLGIARAIVNNPSLILADEPTGNLDPDNGEAIMALLECINREGTTVIACTHDKALVDRMGKRVLEFLDGKLVRDESHSTYAAQLCCSDRVFKEGSGPCRDFVRQWEYNTDLEDELKRRRLKDFKVPQVDDMQKLIIDSYERRAWRRQNRKKR